MSTHDTMVNHGVPRRRVALSALTAVFTIVAVACLRHYIAPGFYWRDLCLLVSFLAFQATFLWLVTSAPWSARVFALGFVLGATVELVASDYYVRNDWLRSTPGTWTPEGWYPLNVPVERLFIQRGWATLADTTVTPIFLGMGLSGALCGGMVFVARAWWRRKTAIYRCESFSSP